MKYINIELSEKNLIYILNCLNLTLRCMEYHYQIYDVKGEVKRYFNYNNYEEDYNDLRLLHRVLSTKGNSEIYGIYDNLFFKGQADYLCTKEKDFKILLDKSRYNKIKSDKIFIMELQNKINNKYYYKFNRYKYYQNSSGEGIK